MIYQPSWNSLKRHTVPQWLRDGKFGIYTHWGVYSVPACGPNVSWYPNNMYIAGSEQNKYHIEHFGGPEKFGYKDFIPMFTGEKFDADEWAELFQKTGARFAGPVAEHHDGFAMWPTRYSKWNAVEMGPRRDVVGLLEKAIRARDMKYMVAFHHAENWKFFPHWRVEFDTSNPEFAGLYGEPHNVDWKDHLDVPENQNPAWERQDKPSRAFLEQWIGKIREVVDNYTPDLLWFDFGLEFVQEHYKREMAAYFYNQAEKQNREVALTYKWHHMVPGSGLEDIELGGADVMRYNEWMTDTTIDDGEAWGYMHDSGYKTSKTLVHYLVDNVSKNGFLLLNIGPKPDGTIPADAQDVLNDIGEWLSMNGEAIYFTTPWMIYGEGPGTVKAGPFNEKLGSKYSAEDIRFTAHDDDLFAILLEWPGRQALIKSFKSLYPDEISSVSLLGNEKPLSWRLTDEGMQISMPEERPCNHAYVIKVSRKKPYEN